MKHGSPGLLNLKKNSSRIFDNKTREKKGVTLDDVYPFACEGTIFEKWICLFNLLYNLLAINYSQ